MERFILIGIMLIMDSVIWYNNIKISEDIQIHQISTP